MTYTGLPRSALQCTQALLSLFMEGAACAQWKKQVAEKSNACICRYSFHWEDQFLFHKFKWLHLRWLVTVFPRILGISTQRQPIKAEFGILGEGWWAGARLFRKTEASHWVGLSRWSTLHSLEQITVVWDCKRLVGRKSHQNENRFGSEKPVTFRSLGLWFRMAFRSVVVRWQFTLTGIPVVMQL